MFVHGCGRREEGTMYRAPTQDGRLVILILGGESSC
jgi:hypothetical protein